MYKSKFFILVLALTLVASGSLLASASTFEVFYDLGGIPKEPILTHPALVFGHGVSGFPLSRGAGIGAYELTKGFSANNWILDDNSLDGAIAGDKYYEFGLLVKDGFIASLETLDLSLRRSALNSPMNYELQVSLDNFATPGITLSSFNYYGRVSGSAPYPDPLDSDPYYYMHSDLPGRPNSLSSFGDPIPTIDLTSFVELQDIPAGTEVIFRLYAWGNSKTSQTNTVALGRIDGPKIIGTVKAK